MGNEEGNKEREDAWEAWGGGGVVRESSGDAGSCGGAAAEEPSCGGEELRRDRGAGETAGAVGLSGICWGGFHKNTLRTTIPGRREYI